ncbi:hypothetical protein BvRS1_57770 [Burkholderia vietnamiensis]|nr:hypothetical protein WK28_04335 [Burkholderia vietnamiensis]KVS12246.1 hypothetical protein WK32_03965 [Burkholderia vietnamiensis]MBE0629182.1 hypothetical protein [Burkholderia vietnamiensis]MBR8226693.1 hypothetical protein [Burkholderia vietnamiensis]GBH28728.1 hypothetical protein BvRS1_57770 [Burkholderia vietnamiensis]
MPGLAGHSPDYRGVKIVTGNYYGAFYKTAMLRIVQHIDCALERWARRKYKGLHGRRRRSADWLDRMRRTNPMLFAHWRVVTPQAG